MVLRQWDYWRTKSPSTDLPARFEAAGCPRFATRVAEHIETAVYWAPRRDATPDAARPSAATACPTLVVGDRFAYTTSSSLSVGNSPSPSPTGLPSSSAVHACVT